MAFTSGTKLGPYEIQSPLGAGGMGEVYRARDTRLNRDVAIKVLPSSLSSDPALRQRLDREAKTVSKLSHGHICTLHDIGHQDGVDYLVMELVEGETLEQRLKKGPLPAEQTLRYAAQIASALAKAHKLGIVHRDLKPANIMLTKSGAKLMDFGLAKESGPAPLATALTEMTAENTKLTVEGTIVGTFQYMSPEQLEGREADARTDLFALGEVIYEMATGQPAFAGKSRASLIAAILSTDPPPMASLQPLTPAALERVVKKCLAKDPDERWQCASDLGSELNWIAEGVSTGAGGVPARSGGRQWIAWALAGTFFLLMLAAGGLWWRASTRRATTMHFQAAVPFAANDLAVAPNERSVVMVAYSTQAKDYLLWTYEIGGRGAVPLEGTQGASYPFWSPDGRSIGFFSDGKLKRIDLTGGQVQVLCDAPNGRGGAWNRDGVILFAPNSLAGLSRVSAQGGPSSIVTIPDPERSETSNRWPVFLPDGNHFLYLGANFSGRVELNAIFLAALDSKEKRLLVNASSNASYSDSGFLLYLRDNALVAQPFDGRSAPQGEMRTVANGVLYSPQVDRAVFSAVGSRVLVAQTGTGAALSQLTWFDRNGKSAGTVGPRAWYDNVRLSPDGRKVATDETDPNGRNVDIWIHDPARNATTRLTFDRALHQTPIWSPDGTQVIFGANPDFQFRLFLKNADGSGVQQSTGDLGSAGLVNPWDWSRDGKYILFRKQNELWYMILPDRTTHHLFPGEWTVRNAQFSPDGRWIAYASNETGRMEIYVTPFPPSASKWQVSTAGGQEPRWRQNGKELFYLSPDGKMMAVAVTAGASFAADPPVTLFQTNRRQAVSSQDVFSYDVSGDGQRFLIVTHVDEGGFVPPSVILDWASQPER